MRCPECSAKVSLVDAMGIASIATDGDNIVVELQTVWMCDDCHLLFSKTEQPITVKMPDDLKRRVRRIGEVVKKIGNEAVERWVEDNGHDDMRRGTDGRNN